MALTEKQLRFLRGKAHALRPVVMLGNKGLTDNVVA
jgi:RNA-binding protein